ncbi:cysteine desulfurase [Streptoalloteichus tenebrarius]|uniref:Cysteine desulfurase n=1 Tax=Streptoalloteichus tenebrarius (strain ATCC 17920 / DSM 40477 / JCM 4838 / CBS 697.72 / NBRC 16177 / NCIMB 11028 / NRRL B-12390 / A12253. 1 / ISP 5477) TaxID=1933 RepID=A0ABT1HWL7_STRSD|nr:cysteine desulfurase family protein [Streptoalloteichus tenebrarius]MCP2259918.1 cysteine desulfurase [Streptoalloteichus tenebrarius]BFF03242.1 cysteine desulfurase family protein [Streptoalloteichus tenebrarius]
MTYLDHAATTPMLPSAVAAMSEALANSGNASSLHTSGRRARRAVEEAREDVALALGARPSEVIFTGGGTESDNLAVKGIYWARRDADPRRRRVLASAVEHHAVLDAVRWLADREGAEVTWLEVDRHGRVRPEVLREAVERDPDSVALVSVMWANNEVGTVNPIAELAEVAHEHGIPLHTDAVQAVGALPVDFAASGADALTLTGHKLGGPHGAGALLLGRNTPCVPLLHGGGQERDVRSGTLDVPGIVGLAVAVREAVAARPTWAEEAGRLRDALVDAVRAAVPDVVVNGDPDPAGRLPGVAHFTFAGCEGDSLLMLLDARGIECSTGSACTAGVAQASHVLLAMGVDPVTARGSLRFSFGHTSTAADVDAVRAAIGPVVERARNAGLAGLRRSAAAGVAAPAAAPGEGTAEGAEAAGTVAAGNTGEA